MNPSPPDEQNGIADDVCGAISRSGLRRRIRAADGKEMTMTACSTNRGISDLPPTFLNETTELMADIDGLPILVRFRLNDVPADLHSNLVSRGTDIHLLLSSTLEKMISRISGTPLRRDVTSKQPLATVELISGGEPLVRLQAQLSETVLRVGSLQIDLIDRTARRGDRQIDLLPREFQLLKYMMQRRDDLLTRATLLKEVWRYRFVPETNLVDVHMGRLRRKVDGPNDPPLIRSVRGVGFILSAALRPQNSQI